MFTLNDSLKVVFDSYYRVKEQFHGYDSDLRDLTGIRRVFELAGIPLNGIPTITITGSKGKGSTSLLCSAFLEEMGYRVGLVTSPHLVEFRERIRINGAAIPESDFIARIMELETIVHSVDATLEHGYLSPTGILLAAALNQFRRQGVDVLVLEAGRGGRFDDVSILQNQVSCLTPIMEEHLDKLGPTIQNVAWHKTGIIQPNTTVISAPQIPSVAAHIQQTVREQNARLWMVGDQIGYAQNFTKPFHQDVHILLAPLATDLHISLHNPAHYLGLNAAVALAAVFALLNPTPAQAAAIGSRTPSLHFAGRCDKVCDAPLVFIDGAINRPSATAFLDSVRPYLRPPVVLITALPEDKDFSGFLEVLMPVANATILTTTTNQNLVFTNAVYEKARQLSADALSIPNVHMALPQAVAMAGTQGTILAVGTQSFVRDALIFWQQNVQSIWS